MYVGSVGGAVPLDERPPPSRLSGVRGLRPKSDREVAGAEHPVLQAAPESSVPGTNESSIDMSLPHCILRDGGKQLLHPLQQDRLQSCQLPVHLDPVDRFVESRRAQILSDEQGCGVRPWPRSGNRRRVSRKRSPCPSRHDSDSITLYGRDVAAGPTTPDRAAACAPTCPPASARNEHATSADRHAAAGAPPGLSAST